MNNVATNLRNLKIAALISALVHTLGAFVMAFVLGPGLGTNPEIPSRIEYIRTHTLWWQLGWIVWIVSALTFLIFTILFRRYHLSLDINGFGRIILYIAMASSMIAVACDVTFECVQIFYLPGLLAGTRAEELTKQFIQNNNMFVLGSGIIANFMYCFATLCSVVATRGFYPKWIEFTGYAVYSVGLAASIFCIFNSIPGMFWSNAILLPLLVIWLIAIAINSEVLGNSQS